MKWDIKIALYLFLAYAFFGISYLFTDGNFIVPLPILFYFIPLVAFIYLIFNGFNRYALFFLFIPLSSISDLVAEYNGIAGELFGASIVSWSFLGLFLFFDESFKAKAKHHQILYSFPLGMILSLLFILESSVINVVILILLAILTSVIIRDDDEKYTLDVPVRRLLILTCFISWMHLITFLSAYLA